MPLYSVKTKRTFKDAADEPYVWEFFIEAESEQLAREISINEFERHIKDFDITLGDLKNNEVKRALIFKNNDGLEPIYYAALGEFTIEEMSKGLFRIKMTPWHLSDDPPF